MSDEELTSRLERLGRSATPPVDGAFANRLEADLRMGVGGSARESSWTGLLLRPATVVAAIIVVVGIAVVARVVPDDPTIAMVSAEGTTVSIPGGSGLEPGRAGLDLPEGSRIEVSEGSSAVVAGVVLEGGSTAIVVDGRIEVVDSPSLTSTVDPSPPSTAATTTLAPPDRDPSDSTTPPTTRVVPGPTVTTTASSESTSPPSTDGADPPRTTIPDSTTTTTAAPSSTDGPSPTAAPSTSPPTTATTESTTTAAPASSSSTTAKPTDVRPAETAVRLSIGPVRNDEATLMWTVEGPTDDIAFWEVRLVRPDASKTVAVIRFAEARRLRVEVPAGRSGFRVVARSGGDGVVARSALVSPDG